jgi:hypothetical protein
MGYTWRIGDGKRVIFWEDQCSLAIQFWEIYSIINEQGKTIKEAWDGVNLRFTFRRIVDSYVFKATRRGDQPPSSRLGEARRHHISENERKKGKVKGKKDKAKIGKAARMPRVLARLDT